MLQVVTGKYFRDVPLHETTHRRVLFTNAKILSPHIDLPMAQLHPATDLHAVTTLWVELFERLEAVGPDGSEEILLSTGGDELLDDVASVLSFALNATFSTKPEQINRLVPKRVDERDRSTPAHVLRRTFDPGLFIQEHEVQELIQFIGQLVALNRKNYVSAMRAIRQVVSASERVLDDPTLAYTMYVAALESLSSDVAAPPVTWEALDSRKRRLIDASLEGLAEQNAERVRSAVLEAERAGATRRFLAFVLGSVSPSYYREEASAAIRPLSAFDLERALKRAYDIRSKNVHGLEGLPPEAWIYTNGAESVNPAGRGLMLSLEGLNRLCRHVIRAYVARSSTVEPRVFEYRSMLPNVLRFAWAPEIWVGVANNVSEQSAARYFEGFLEVLISTLGSSAVESAEAPEPSRNRTISVDMRPVLNRIEDILPRVAHPSARRSLIAIYFLWHEVMSDGVHLPTAGEFLERFAPELVAPSIQGFVVSVLTGRRTPWTSKDFQNLIQHRLAARTSRTADPLPAAFDAALAAAVAMRLANEEQHDLARAMLSRAVEELPGNAPLMEAESGYRDSGQLDIDLTNLVLGVPLPNTNTQGTGDSKD